jgi:hypothetical protein
LRTGSIQFQASQVSSWHQSPSQPLGLA